MLLVPGSACVREVISEDVAGGALSTPCWPGPTAARCPQRSAPSPDRQVARTRSPGAAGAKGQRPRHIRRDMSICAPHRATGQLQARSANAVRSPAKFEVLIELRARFHRQARLRRVIKKVR